MEKLFIPVLLGTARAERQSEKVARYVLGRLQAFGFETTLVDVRDYPLAATVAAWADDERVRPWRELLAKADGLVVVSPEYNHSFPGEMKLLVDSAYKEYAHKAVAFCGVSNGPFGGVRLIESLRALFAGLGMMMTQNTLSFGMIKDAFDENGQPKDPQVNDRAQKLCEELALCAQALKAARTTTK